VGTAEVGDMLGETVGDVEGDAEGDAEGGAPGGLGEAGGEGGGNGVLPSTAPPLQLAATVYAPSLLENPSTTST